jgi:hypothetical protein
MYKVNLSLKLVTTCPVVGKDIPYFIEKVNSSGLYTYIEDYRDDEEYGEDDEVDVMIFKLDTK